jgi:hypothetical protein
MHDRALLGIDHEVVLHARLLEVTAQLGRGIQAYTFDGESTSTMTIGLLISRSSDSGSGKGATSASGTKALCLLMRTVGPSGAA